MSWTGKIGWWALGVFYLFAGFCVLAMGFVYMFVPETKGITLEEMEFNLKGGVRLRELGNRSALRGQGGR